MCKSSCGFSRQLYAALTIALCVLAGCSQSTQVTGSADPIVRLSTTMGMITLRLDIDRAPVSVANFLDYVEAGFYDNTIMHRVIPGFVIQGGEYTQDLEKKAAGDTIICESNNGLSNLRGTIAVARSSSPNSGTCQYFINLVDNRALDRNEEAHRTGYAVFGHVISSMSVVDAIASVPTSTQQTPEGALMHDVPVTAVIVLSAKRIK